MVSTVSGRAPAWADGVPVSGAEMRAALGGSLWATAGLVTGLRPIQLPTPDMHIRVPAGRCIVSDGAGGMIPIELLTQTDLDIAASSPTLPRIDSLIAEFVDNGGSSLYRFRVLTGTPSASPSAPSLPAGDQPTGKTLRIANVSVAANATTVVNANISLQTTMAIPAMYNAVPLVASDGGRPTEVTVGGMRWRTDKSCFDVVGTNGSWFEMYVNGGGPTWVTYTPSVTASTSNPNLGTGSIVEAAWWRSGKTIAVRCNVKFGTSGSAAGSGTYRISLPAAAKTLSTGRHTGSAYAYDDSGTNFIDGVCIVDSGTWDRVNLVVNNTLSTNAAPWTWTNLDAFGFTLVYEAA